MDNNIIKDKFQEIFQPPPKTFTTNDKNKVKTYLKKHDFAKALEILIEIVLKKNKPIPNDIYNKIENLAEFLDLENKVDIDALFKKQITEAFKDVPYPGNYNIAVGPRHEPELTRNFFRGKKWQDVNWEKLSKEYKSDKSAIINFMTPEAFRYFLPAYMFMALKNNKEMDITYDFFIGHLTNGMHGKDYFDKRFECFNNDIKNVIAKFIWKMDIENNSYSNGAERVAFDSYWHQYYKPD